MEMAKVTKCTEVQQEGGGEQQKHDTNRREVTTERSPDKHVDKLDIYPERTTRGYRHNKMHAKNYTHRSFKN